jgi:predicted permease
VIATAIGLFLNLARVALPEFIQYNIQRMGSASIPLGLITVGAGLTWMRCKKGYGASDLLDYTTKLMVYAAICTATWVTYSITEIAS